MIDILLLPLLVFAQTDWQLVDGFPWSYLDESNEQFTCYVFENNTSCTNPEPEWSASRTWERKVTEANPSPNPSWSTKCATLGDSSFTSNCSGGSVAVGPYTRWIDYVPFPREVGKETWIRDVGGGPELAVRNRTWEHPGSLSYRTELIGGSGGGPG